MTMMTELNYLSSKMQRLEEKLLGAKNLAVESDGHPSKRNVSVVAALRPCKGGSATNAWKRLCSLSYNSRSWQDG